jgi:maltodextrin utilization protein YvdJ
MYLKIQWQLILVFVLFSVLMIPTFVFYGKNDAYTFETTVNGVKMPVPAGMEAYSLGNLGYASV